MSVQTRSVIWGLPKFQSTIETDQKNISNDPAIPKYGRQKGKKVAKINVKLSETQEILVDYTKETLTPTIRSPKNKIMKWSTKSNIEINEPRNSSKEIKNITSKTFEFIPLKMPTWSLDQVKLRFLGYLGGPPRTNLPGRSGDFYLTMTGVVWLKEANEWHKIVF